MSLLLKDPEAVLDYAIDWGAEYLGEGDLLAASLWWVEPDEPDGVAIAGDDFSPAVSTVKAAGGVPGRIYHSAFETFCLIERGTMTRVEVPSLSIGSVIETSIGGRFMTSAAVDQLHLGAWMGKSHHVAAIEPPSGGATIDREARNSIDQILGALREYGLIDAGSVS